MIGQEADHERPGDAWDGRGAVGDAQQDAGVAGRNVQVVNVVTGHDEPAEAESQAEQAHGERGARTAHVARGDQQAGGDEHTWDRRTKWRTPRTPGDMVSGWMRIRGLIRCTVVQGDFGENSAPQQSAALHSAEEQSAARRTVQYSAQQRTAKHSAV